MKSYIKSAFLALGAIALFASCDENAWNDDLDGFEVPEIGNAKKTVNYTLTAADYNQISTGSVYTAYAKEQGPEAEAALKLVGSTQSFANEDDARAYLKLFLANSSNNFYVLSNGSAVKVTYNLAGELPDVVNGINASTDTYTVTEEDYIAAYGSDEDYIDAFSPATPASRSIPGILKTQFPDAAAGRYAVVTYNQASQNPIFTTVGGGDEPGFEITSTLFDLAVGDNVDVLGYVTAINSRGFVLTDNAGSILCYQASGFNVDNVAIGDVVSISSEVGAYNKGFQFAISDGSYTVEGSSKYTYPAPTDYTGAMMDEAITRTDNAFCEYVSIVGKASVSGNYYNFIVDGAATAQGSGYMVPDAIRAQITDGETYRINGYFSSISGGRYFNMVIVSVENMKNATPAKRAPAAPVPSTVTNAMYSFNGTSWSAVNDVVLLQPADYTAMGQSYGNLSGNLPSQLLPKFLTTNFPYAAADDVKTVAYLYYGSDKVTAYRADQYVFDGSEWTLNTGAEPITSQFVRQDGNWTFDPSVVLTLPYARNTDPSYTTYMACVQWVFDNISKPMGGTSLVSDKTNPTPFIDYRGNAEFYSGASAFYGNVDVRASTAKTNAPADYTGYDGLSDEEITLLIKRRFCFQTMPGALAALYPDATPIAGMDVTYTINFTAYEDGGVTTEYTVIYKVEGPAKFTFVSCNWFAEGEATPLD